MLLKRSLILAAGVLLFIVAFIAYFQISHFRMEERFRAEREKFNIHQGEILTASDSATPAPAAATPAPDTNTLIGPVPPSIPPVTDGTATPTPANPNAAASTVDTNSAPATPDMNSAPVAPATDTNAAPVAPDTNSAPAAPAAPSTMNIPRKSGSPFFQLAAYRPSETAKMAMADARVGDLPAPATNTTAPAPATTIDTTSAAPIASSTTASPKQSGKVIVLLYHQFKAAGVPIPAKFQWTMNVDVFEAEMKYIHDNGYNVIPMSDLLKFLHHQISLPSNSVCITIDDGYKSAIVYAAPVLKKYGYPWTFFIYPQFITTAEGPGAASWNDLLQLQAEGIDIECHSMTHPQLPRKGNKTPDQYAAWLVNETAGAKAILEQKMGRPIPCFAYPYGAYNKQVEAAVIAAGFDAIFTVADNPVHPTTDLHSIGRYTITQGVEKNFAAYLRQGALVIASASPEPGATISDPRPVITATLDYPGTIDPTSIETSVRDYNVVRHDFDPQTKTLRLYLPRDLIAPVVLVNIRIKDAVSGQYQVANWHFNYEPGGAAADSHPLNAPAPAVAPTSSKISLPATNAPEATEPLEKTAVGTPLDAHTSAPAPAAVPPKTD